MSIEEKIKAAQLTLSEVSEKAISQAKEALESDTAKELGNAAKETAVSALKSDELKQVAAGAIAGGAAASVIPVIGTGVGAAAGAIMGAYKVATK